MITQFKIFENDDFANLIKKSFIIIFFMKDNEYLANNNFILILDPKFRTEKTDEVFIKDVTKFLKKNNLDLDNFTLVEDPIPNRYRKDYNKISSHYHYRSEQKIDNNELEKLMKIADFRAKVSKYNL